MSCALFEREWKREWEHFPNFPDGIWIEYEWFCSSISPKVTTLWKALMRAMVCIFSQQLEKRKPTNEITFHGKFVTQKFVFVHQKCCMCNISSLCVSDTRSRNDDDS